MMKKLIQTDDHFAVLRGMGPPARVPPAFDTSNRDPNAVLDTRTLLGRLGGDRKLLREMVEVFLSALPVHLSYLKDAVDRKSAPALNSAARALRVSVSNFAARPTSEAALRLERIGRQRDLTEADSAFQALEDEIEHLELALTDLIGSLERCAPSSRSDY